MVGKREKPEDIVLKLRQIEVPRGQSLPIADAVRQAGISQQTYYRWRKRYGGLMPSEVKRVKMLEDENGRLMKRMVADLSLDKAMASHCPQWVQGQWRADVLLKKL